MDLFQIVSSTHIIKNFLVQSTFKNQNNPKTTFWGGKKLKIQQTFQFLTP